MNKIEHTNQHSK